MTAVDVAAVGREPRPALPYLIMDADQHTNPPPPGVFEQYIDPAFRDRAVRDVTLPDGTVQTLYAGRPARLAPKKGEAFQVTIPAEELEALGLAAVDPLETGGPIPGSFLTKLNPLRKLDAEGRKAFVQHYRHITANIGTPEMRLGIMDMQGIECTVNYLTISPESNFEHDVPALYANQRAVNRYCAETWGFVYRDRIFSPPFIAMVDPDLAMAELEYCMANGAKVIQISAGPTLHRSPFRPELDRFWSVANEAGIRVCTHLPTSTFYGRQGEEWDETDAITFNMNAFQWTLYGGDRSAYETVAAAILQGWFSRFPNMRLLLSEQGTVWVPYIVRKMDHAFAMGRRATWGKLEMRPSEYFRRHIVVAPYPEENVQRVVDAVGVEPVVFGSDFPHGEGLPDPSVYLSQLAGFDDAQVKAIMRDNMARYFVTD